MAVKAELGNKEGVVVLVVVVEEEKQSIQARAFMGS